MVPQLFDIDTTAPEARGLLDDLVAQGSGNLVAAATVPRRLFGITSPLAPGLSFVGAEARLWPGDTTGLNGLISAGGVGTSLADAMASCLGETIERLSQAERAGDVVFQGTMDEAGSRLCAGVVELAGTGCTASVDWVRGHCGEAGREVLIPADWVLRRRADGPLKLANTPLSTGVAAGPTPEAARQRAVFELVERDAVAHWWLGGQRGRPLPLDTAAEAAALLMLARAGTRSRTSWLLDVTTDLAIPCVVAVSVGVHGKALACGMAARATSADAARAAVLEMCQMELALLVVELKRQERGDAALNAVDRQHLQRAVAIDADTCALLHPVGSPRREPLTAVSHDVTAVLSAGTELAVVDLTRPALGIPVAAAIAPQLQRFPSDVRTKRLLEAIERHGGGTQWTHGVPLA